MTARGAEESLVLSAADCDAPEVQEEESDGSSLAIQPGDEDFTETETGRTLAVKKAEEESLGGTVTVIASGTGASLVTEVVPCPLAEVASCTAELEQVD